MTLAMIPEDTITMRSRKNSITSMTSLTKVTSTSTITSTKGSTVTKRTINLSRTRTNTVTSSNGTSRSASQTRSRSSSIFSRRLYSFQDLPFWQQDNDKILTGYVRETNSFSKCIRSLFYFNNESVNIYSHLIPSIAYLCLSLFLIDTFLIPSFPTTSTSDYVFINVFLMGAFFCMLCSGCFHCLKQHSEKYSNFWSKLDYLGIIILIACSMISLVYFGYFDHLAYFKFFVGLTCVLAILCSMVVMHEKFNVAKYRPLRAGFFATFGLSGIIPLATGFYIFGFHGVLQRINLTFVLWEALFYIVGATLYGLRIPESILPGKFDLVGSSHQVFHCLVVAGSVCHLKAVIESYRLVHSNFKK